jgi:hypothetical protein
MAMAVQFASDRTPRRVNPGLAGLILLVVLWMLIAIYAGSLVPLQLVTSDSMEPTLEL